MTGRIQPTLTPDVQQALEHAVVEANLALSNLHDDQVSTKKKRKRVREGGERTNKRVKKGKERVLPQDEVAQSSDIVGPVAPNPGEHSKESETHQNPASNSNDLSQIDPELLQSSNLNSSTSAFLSAIVAAASATKEATANQDIPPYSHPQYVLNGPPLSQHYMPHAPMPYPYHVPPVGQSSQPSLLSPLVPLSEMSNEDILRALQDLDIHKITTVLKTLNDAASAANISLTPQPVYMQQSLPHGSQMHAPALLAPVPTPSTALRTPQLQNKNQWKPDMALHGPQHVNRNHAELLSTKWLTANKLAELVKTEGNIKSDKFLIYWTFVIQGLFTRKASFLQLKSSSLKTLSRITAL
jgi:hypothetical protein